MCKMKFRITPSSFPSDPIGHVGNQFFHGLIGAGAMAILPMSWWSMIGVAVVYFVGIEGPQIRDNNTRRVLADSVEDAMHVSMGAIIVLTGAVWAIPAWLAVLGVGAWFRT
jgi:hypothetical protein